MQTPGRSLWVSQEQLLPVLVLAVGDAGGCDWFYQNTLIGFLDALVCNTRPCGLPLTKQEVLASAKGHCHRQKLQGFWLGWDHQVGVNSVWSLCCRGGWEVIGILHRNVIALGEVTAEMTCMLNR